MFENHMGDCTMTSRKKSSVIEDKYGITVCVLGYYSSWYYGEKDIDPEAKEFIENNQLALEEIYRDYMKRDKLNPYTKFNNKYKLTFDVRDR